MLVQKGTRCEVGSKAFDLYRCKLLGMRVPRFYVIPVSMFKTCGGKDIDGALARELEFALRELGGTVAVRSSSIAEDLESGSNAGHFKTVLNVGSLPALLAAVKAVWDSADGHDMAVIIQEQLHPDIAGVLFTRNPASGKDETVIEHVDGLCESLVSGKRNPKRRAFDNSKLPVGPFRRLLIHARKMERAFGYPLDIEWARCKGRFHILQARPITRLPVPRNTAGLTYSRVQAEQFNSGPVSPLFFSLFKTLHTRYYLKDTLDAFGLQMHRDPPIVRHKNYLYFDTRYAEQALLRIPLKDSQKNLMEIFPEDIRKELIGKKKRLQIGFAARVLWLLASNPNLRIGNLDRHFERKIVPRLISELKAIGNPRTMSNQRLKESLVQVVKASALHIRTSKWGLGLYSIPLVGVMERFLEKNGFDKGLTPALISGLDMNRTLDGSTRLRDLARSVRADKGLVKVFEMDLGGYPAYKAELQRTSKGEYVLDSFESILMAFGHRRLARDILHPSWNDDPMIPLSILRTLVLDGDATDGDGFGSASKERERVREMIEARLPTAKRLGFRTLAGYLVRYTAFREYQRFYLDLILSKARPLYVEIGRRMARDGILERAEDVFYLEIQDIEGYLSKGPRTSGLCHMRADLKRKDLKNKAEFNRLSFEPNRPTPGRYLRNGVDFDELVNSEDTVEDADAIRGQAISPGMFSGRVRIIDDLGLGSQISKGDIVVTRALDPGQTHMLLLAGALVLEVGGMLSHGAIAAREMGLPTVGSVKNATRLFKDGQRVTVDGKRGVVAFC